MNIRMTSAYQQQKTIWLVKAAAFKINCADLCKNSNRATDPITVVPGIPPHIDQGLGFSAHSLHLFFHSILCFSLSVHSSTYFFHSYSLSLLVSDCSFFIISSLFLTNTRQFSCGQQNDIRIHPLGIAHFMGIYAFSLSRT